MEWLSNITFTIYSVGDGLFMSTVLNAIGALSNSGFFQSLGLLGMMLGLLLMGFNGLATGKAEFQNIFISLILFSLMFGGKADVVIQDIGFAPGEYTENVYTVDNVPFGVAAMGWLISNVSYGITDKLEQAYGSPVNSVGNTSSVGFGRSLDWLSAIKFAKDTNSGCTSTTLRYCYWRKNLTHFIAQCTSRAVATDAAKNATRRVTADAFSTDGIGYMSAYDTLPWLDLTTGAESIKTCQDATADLKTYATSGDFTDDYARNVASRIGFGGVNTPSQELLDSFDSMGLDPTVTAKFMANIIIDEQMKIATTGVAIADTNSLVNHAMVTNASAQRADKLAGEESLFKLMMRPLMAFFESFVYIASPFMALVIGFGPKGYGMVIKYALTTLWVALWMPTLSAINLFQNTMLERALSQFTGNANTDVGYNNIASLNGSQAAYDEIITWVATGSTLAAATPAITMMLIYGTSQAATSLAASTSGAGFVNEKMTSPDVASTPAVYGRGTQSDWTAGGGSVGSGVSEQTFSASSGSQFTQSGEVSAANKTSQGFAASYGYQVASAVSHDVQQGGQASTRAENRAMAETSNASTWAKTNGIAGSADSNYATHLGAAFSVDAKGGPDVAAGIAGKASRWADNTTSALAGMSEGDRGKALNDMGLGAHGKVGASAGVQAGWRDEIKTMASDATRIGTNFSNAMRQDEGARAAVMSGLTQVAESFGKDSSTESNKLTGSNDFKKSSADMKEAAETFRNVSAATQGFSGGQSLKTSQIAEGMSGAADQVKSAYIANGGTDDSMRAGAASYGNSLGGEGNRQVAAMMSDMLNGKFGSAGYADAVGLLQDQGLLHASAPSSIASPSSEGLGPTSKFGETEALVNSQPVGVNQAAVESDVASAQARNSTEGGRFASAAGVNPESSGPAMAGGARAAAMDAGGGQVNNENADAFQAPLEAKGQANLESQFGAAKESQDTAKAGLVKDNFTQIGDGDDKSGIDSMKSRLDGSTGGSGGDNPFFESLKDDAKSGKFTGNVPQSDDMATVLAGMAAIKRSGDSEQGGRLSAEQGAEWSAAYDRLSPEQQSAVGSIASEWSDGHSATPNLSKDLSNSAGAAPYSLGGPSEGVGVEALPSGKFNNETPDLGVAQARHDATSGFNAAPMFVGSTGPAAGSSGTVGEFKEDMALGDNGGIDVDRTATDVSRAPSNGASGTFDKPKSEKGSDKDW